MIETLNYFSRQWAEYFGLAVLQNTLFIGIIFLMLALFKKANAKVRYSIAVLGLLKLLLPPVLPAPFLKSSIFAPTTMKVSIGDPLQADAVMIGMKIHPSWYAYLFLLWLFVAAVLIFIPIVSTWRLKRKLANAPKISLDEISHGNNYNNVDVVLSSHINMPLTIGILKKKICLPLRWRRWSPTCRKLILAHELAHVKRYDGIVQYLQILVQAIYFFHPLVWLLSIRINELREMACDDEAIAQSKISPLDYSRYLVHVAESMVRSQLGYTSVSALIRQKNKLLKRVNYQMKEEKVKHLSKNKTVLIIAGLMVLMLPLSWYCSKEKPSENVNSAPPTEGQSADIAGFVAYDEPPEPIGGFAAIQQNLHYPEIARKAGIEGRVVVKVLIDENGNVADAVIVKSLGKENGCDEAAINALKAVKWIPAKQRGQPVKVWVAMPVVFRLSKSTTSVRKPAVEIRVNGRDDITVNGRPATLSTLKRILEEEFQKKGNTFSVHVAENVPREIVVEVLQIQKQLNEALK